MRISDWSSDVCSSDLVLRRRGAGRQPALLDGGGGDESRPQPPRLLRRPHRRPGVPQRHGGLAAADGRAAGRHRDLAGRAGQGVEEAGNREPDPCRRPAVSRAMPLSRLLPDVAAVPPELAITGLVLDRSEEHTSELQSLMRISYAVLCLKK